MDTLVVDQAENAKASEPVVPDRFAAQLVPTSVIREDGTYRIRASVAFTPVPGTDLTGVIDNWPSWIAGLFDSGAVKVRVRQAMTEGTGTELTGKVTNSFVDAYPRIDRDRANAIAKLDTIWLRWFAESTSLRSLLRAAATKTARNPTMFQDAEADGTPDVISVPRGELARQTTLQRAGNVIESLASAQSPEESEKARKQRELRKAALPGPAHRPWAKVPLGSERTRILRDLLGKTPAELKALPASELRLAKALEDSELHKSVVEQENKEYATKSSQGSKPDPTLGDWRKDLDLAAPKLSEPKDKDEYEPHRWEQMPAKKWAVELEAYLKDERCWLELTLAHQLADQRDAARKYAESCKDCTDACSTATIQLAGYLDKLKGHRVAHRASHIETTAQAAAGTAYDEAAAKDAAAQYASTVQDYGRPEKYEETIGVMQLRWHALQGMPALMRAMHLTMDIEFTLIDSELTSLDAELPANGGLTDSAYFVEFALSATDLQGGNLIHQPLWTLTKLGFPASNEPADGGHCWPTTTEEWALRSAKRQGVALPAVPEDSGFLDQVDAVVDLDAPLMTNGRSFKRYDVFSLDATIASEAEQRRQAAEVQVRNALTPLPEPKPENENEKKAPHPQTVVRQPLLMPEAEQASAAETSTLKTGGLQIVDRWRQGAVIDEIFTSCNAQSPEGRRVDANDLLIGYRFDVGLPQPNDADRHWTSLSERIVSYEHSTPRDLADLNAIVDAFSPPGTDGVRAVDGATVAMGTRLVRNSQSGIASGGKETAFAEQLLAVWDGDPIGMRTGAFESVAEAIDLPVTRILSLPVKGGSRAHRLRFGGAYALGARAVLVGGACAPLGRAIAMYDGGLGRGMAYPSSKAELQRFLRQERIGPPIVAVEAGLLINEFASERKGIDGKDMVVRSLPATGANGEEDWRFGPDETARILFAPLVDLDFAVMHGVFDGTAGRLRGQPPGGLQDVDYDAEWGGFPLFDPLEPPVAEAIRGTYRPYETHDEHGNERPQKITPGGFAVFRKWRKPDPKADPPRKRQEYYPDPAAGHLVIALRYPDQPNRYLDDEAIRIPLFAGRPEGYVGTPGYPDARPVRIRVKAVPSSAKPLRSHRDLEHRAAEADVRFKEMPSKGEGPAVMTVTLCLAPGEDFEVETWCLPSKENLQAWFDLPEAMALIMGCAVDSPSVQRCMAIAKENEDQGSADTVLLRRGEASIRWLAVKQAASMAYDTLLRRPLPDIASVRRLRAIHANGLPKAAPTIEDIRLSRLSAAAQKNWLAKIPVPDEDEDGGSNIVVEGQSRFDVDTTETLELHAEAVMPFGGAFDNLELGRGFYARARGEWPRTRRRDEDDELEPVKKSQRQPELDALSQPTDADSPAATGEDARTYMDELFGFDVARDGKAKARRGKGLVARWRIGRTEPQPADFATLTRQGMPAAPTDEAEPSLAEKTQAALEGIFPDTLARRVTLWLEATSRTARHIPDRTSYPTPAEADVDRERLFRKSWPPKQVILPATDRPAALTPKSLLPAYLWTDKDGRRTRRTKVRIRLRRPWWTSGEDERLGIVVWPPNLKAAIGTRDNDGWSDAELRQGRILRKTPMAPGEAPDEIDLHSFAAAGTTAKWREGFFTDADLGLGGSYVTRWGADPIYASEEMAWLIPKAAFRDISASQADAADSIDLIDEESKPLGELWPADESHKPRFVENALMPIPDADDSEADKEKAQAAKRTPEFMMVSLVTYAPRFDPDFEHWYVDVDLDVGAARDPFVRFGLVRFQPFAKRHLQVSHPVAEWVQVAGYMRDVIASRFVEGGRHWARVEVGLVEGVPSGKTPDPNVTGTPADETPLLRLTLIECTRSPHGQILERIARLDPMEVRDVKVVGTVDPRADGLVTITRQVSSGASRLLDLRLPIPSPSDGPDLHFAVLVEELTTTARSTFSNEPVRSDTDILKDERYIESGVRFAVRVELDEVSPPPEN